jgi:hypothetical protein
MVIYVLMETFRMMPYMNKFTNNVTDDGRVHPLAISLPSRQQLVMEYCHG